MDTVRVCARGLEPLDDALERCPEHGARALVVDRSSGDARVGARAADRYVITGVIARGGMGVVYAAHHEALGRDVALKVLEGAEKDDPEFVARFAREAKIAAALRSPHVVEVYDAGVLETGELYLVMARLAGRSLEVAAGEGWPIKRALDAAAQLCSALADAHAVGVVHRDLKPSNVIVRDDGHITVIDFGLARRLDADDATLTRAGQLYGTPAFMPPEQWDEEAGELTPAADVYMLGATLFQLATGQRCFAARSLPGLMRQHLYEPPPSLARWAEQRGRDDDPRWSALAAVVARCLAKAPEARYPSGAEVQVAIEAVRALTPPTGASGAALHDVDAAPNAAAPTDVDALAPTHVRADGSSPTSLTSPPRRWRFAAIAVAVIIAAAALIGGVGDLGRDPAPLSVGAVRTLGDVDTRALPALSPAIARCGRALAPPATLFLGIEPSGEASSVELRPRSAAGDTFAECLLPELSALRFPLRSRGALGVISAELAR